MFVMTSQYSTKSRYDGGLSNTSACRTNNQHGDRYTASDGLYELIQWSSEIVREQVIQCRPSHAALCRRSRATRLLITRLSIDAAPRLDGRFRVISYRWVNGMIGGLWGRLN